MLSTSERRTTEARYGIGDGHTRKTTTEVVLELAPLLLAVPWKQLAIGLLDIVKILRIFIAMQRKPRRQNPFLLSDQII